LWRAECGLVVSKVGDGSASGFGKIEKMLISEYLCF